MEHAMTPPSYDNDGRLEIAELHGSRTYVELASKHLAKNDPESAWSYAQKALALIDDDDKSELLLHGLLLSGEAALRSGLEEEARECFSKVQEILPEYPGLVEFLFNVDVTDVIEF